jgi:Cytochrome c554 and c-prime
MRGKVWRPRRDPGRGPRSLPRVAGWALLFLSAPAATVGAQEAEIERYRHLGAASCASSVCHGKIAPQPGRTVGLNEYRTWIQDDAHSRAYRVLEQPLSKRMTALLGLGNPTTEKICLDCHADNVPKDKRGPKFQISDGIGCEACHGGAEKWIESHAVPGRAHRDNLAQGMYPSEQPLPRARLCLSCHMGTKDKLADHAIMAAGHPRLAFELEAYTNNQPAHFTVDEDYRKRKGNIEGMNLWITGQIESARAMLALQRSDRFQASGSLFPELALYDCHSCHHAMDKARFTPARVGGGVRPGDMRLQTQNLAILAAVLIGIEPAKGNQLAALTQALVKAGQRDRAAVNAAAGAVLDWLKEHEVLSRRPYTKTDVVIARRMLLRLATSDKVTDYAVAEQIVLGVESLSYTAGDRTAKKASLDKLYAAVKSSTSFSPTQFATAAKTTFDRF